MYVWNFWDSTSSSWDFTRGKCYIICSEDIKTIKKLLILLVVILTVNSLSAKELTDTKYHEYLDCMEFLGSMKLEGMIQESVLLENNLEPKLTYQVFYDFNTQSATVKVSNLKLHDDFRGITSEQFIESIINFYLNTEVPEGDGTIIYK